MFSFTKVSIVRAALALAAVASSVVMPFAQPASANQYPADIQVEQKDWDWQGPLWSPGSPPPDGGKVHVMYGIYNYGGNSSGVVTVTRKCIYSNKTVTLPALTLSPLGSGGNDVIWFDCPKISGSGKPTGSSVKATGAFEPTTKINSANTDSQVFNLVG